MSDEISYVGDNGDNFLEGGVTFYKGMHEGKEADFVKIPVPGDKTLVIDTLADGSHKKRFARQWAAYEGMHSMKGTPLTEWTEIPETLRNEFAYQGFRYIEQIAGAPESAFTRMMGGIQWRTKAQAWLNRGKIDADAVIKQQAEEMTKLKEQMAILMDALNKGQAQAVPDEKPETKKRGPKPKSEE